MTGPPPDGAPATRRRPTMHDVAALAGVSPSTVSRVMDGHGAVRADLAQRVREAVTLLGYRRDLTASTLRRADRASASVGLVVEDVANPFFSSIHRGVEEVARSRGVLTFVGSSDEDPERERELVHGLCERRVDGLVIAPVERNHAYLLRDLEAGMAVVFVDRPPEAIEADAVLVDNAGAAGGGRPPRGRGAPAHRLPRRPRAGVHGARAEPRLSRSPRGSRPWPPRRARADGAVREPPVLSSHTRPLRPRAAPTALVTGQNFITVGAVHALQALGRQHEVALVGIDDVVMGDAVEPRLTVISQDPLRMGRTAGELPFARLDGQAGPARRITRATGLLVRGSGEIAPAPTP